MSSPVLLTMLSLLLGGCAVGLTRTRDMFAMMVLLSAYSAFFASTILLLGGIDVAFTETVVGASISTVFLMMLLRWVDPWDKTLQQKRQRVLGAAAATALGAVLMAGVLALPRFGDPEAPVHTHIADDFIRNAYPDTHTPNVVTAVLADYRGFDTLIETSVVLTAALVCLLILGMGNVEERKDS